MKQKRSRLWFFLLALVVAVAVTLAVNYKAVRLVFYNVTVPVYDLDEARDDWS